MLSVGSSLRLHRLPGEVGFLPCHEKRDFLRLAWDMSGIYLRGVKSLSFQGSISCQGPSPAVPSAGPGWKPLPRASLPCLHSLLQRQACAPRRGPAGHCVGVCTLWTRQLLGSHGHGGNRWMRESHKGQGPRERAPLCRGLCTPVFMGPTPLANPCFPRLDWQASSFPTSPQLHGPCICLSCVPSLPPEIYREWAGGCLWSITLQLPGEAAQMAKLTMIRLLFASSYYESLIPMVSIGRHLLQG